MGLSELAVRPNYSVTNNYQGVVKRVEAIYRPDQVIAVMRRAFSALRNGAPGPVAVELIADVCETTATENISQYIPPRTVKQQPDSSDIKAAVQTLLGARRPMLWAGAGVLFAGAMSELKNLAELTATPVFTTMPGKSGFDERHPLALGAGCGTTTGPAHQWLENCDVLLAIGSSLTRSHYAQSIRSDVCVIQNTNNPDDIGKDEDVRIGLVGDAKLTLRALIEEVEVQLGTQTRDCSEVVQKIQEWRKKWLEDWTTLLESDSKPLNTYRVIKEIDRVLDHENSIVTHDAGAPRDSIVPFYTATTPHSYIGWGKTTHLGFGIPLMIGAKLAHPQNFCLNLMGDGAFGMSGTDIETAARSEIPITTVLLNNGGMATYPGGFPTAGKKYGVSEMYGDYAQIAEGMGAVGIVVDTPAELTDALRRAQRLNQEGRTVLIDVHSDMESRRSRWD